MTSWTNGWLTHFKPARFSSEVEKFVLGDFNRIKDLFASVTSSTTSCDIETTEFSLE
jgi:hypothetical protein